MMHRMNQRLAFLLLLSLASQACQSPSGSATGVQTVGALVRAGQFERAVISAQANVDQDPADLRAKGELRDARIAMLVAEGRRLSFEGASEEGLELFYRAQELDPENEVVRDWVNKTRIQIAEDTLTLSGTLIARDELRQRRDLLRKVLAYLPADEHSERVENLRLLGSSSLERVEQNLSYCEARGEQCFKDGLGSLAQGNLHESLRDFSASLQFEKNFEGAINGYRKANILEAEGLLEQALEYERMGLFDAARKEFERVHDKDPGNQVASKGLNRMEREVRFGRALRKAEMAVLRGAPEDALELLSDAEKLTLVQQDRVEEMRMLIRDAGWEELYQEALTLEAGGNLPDAVVAYGKLLADADEYKEASVRKSILEEFIGKAQVLYGRAAEAQDPAEEYSLLREIQILWPGYRDVKARVAKLKKSLDALDPGAQSTEPERPLERRGGRAPMGEDN